MPYDKLYIRIRCMTCNGDGMLANSSYHNPLNPYKWKECPYCDTDGLILIEASKETVVRYLQTLSESDLTFIVRNVDNMLSIDNSGSIGDV